MGSSYGEAPGWPGMVPHWTSSAKSGVGTAINPQSHVWFTVSHGIFDEIYYGRIDKACTRDLGLLITDGAGFFSEEKRQTTNEVHYPIAGVPLYHLVNTCEQGRYRIEKEILTDPQRDVVLQQTRFIPLQGTLTDYHLYVLLAPHINNRGAGNTAYIDEYKGVPMLFAERESTTLALACSAPWLGRSAGYVGASDGWQDVHAHGQMTWHYTRAANGNVALIGEVNLQACEGHFLLALGFGLSLGEAGQRARASLQDGLKTIRERYIHEWQTWQQHILPLEQGEAGPRKLYRVSTAVLRSHEAKYFPGGTIASLSVPWGFAKGDDDLGGYHLLWPRDLIEAVGGLLAAREQGEAKRVLYYLQATQEEDGHWPQNMWLDGTPYWNGIQLDETAFPILLVGLARQETSFDRQSLERLWPMLRRAAGFVVRNGPVTQQDRWEENPGYSPFTLAVEVAALLVAADLADLHHEPEVATYLRETADTWNENIERWTYVTNTPLAQQLGVEGYYVRIAPPDTPEASSPKGGYVPIKNRPVGQGVAPAVQIVSPDALALVRFGLRAADDPRILNTIKVIDALLRVETPHGPAWHRYNGDGYGEHADGAPFDGQGIGRAWPLLTGERAHYELAAGRKEVAEQLLQALEAFASDGGMLPEQIWDAPDLPEKNLFLGRPSGSAMPLVWAHAEYLKLCRSLHEGRIFDMPQQTAKRYAVERRPSPYALWRFNQKVHSIPAGKTLRVEVLAPAIVHWSADNWHTLQDTPTCDTGLGVHLVDLPTAALPTGTRLQMTFYWSDAQHWEGTDFEVELAAVETWENANRPYNPRGNEG